MLDGAGSFITKKGLDIRASAPTVAPLVKCQCSRSTTPLLHPTQPSTPTQPKKPVPSILTLHEEDESEPEQQEPGPD